MVTIAVCSQKGGTGKTTTAAALAAGLARRGYRVLAVDADAQGSLTKISTAQALPLSLSDIIAGRKAAAAVVQETPQGFYLIPGNLELTELPKGYKLDKLRGILSRIGAEYDYCIIDTAPALSVLTMSALVAAAVVVIPLLPESLSLFALDQIAETIEAVKPYNPGLRSIGVLLTRYNARANLDRIMRDSIEQRAAAMGAKVYSATIRAQKAIGEAQLLRQDIFTSAPRAGVTADYNAFIDELLKGD